MTFVAVTETDQGPPPPPPPIYADKTKGSKVVVGAELYITLRYDHAVSPRCEQQGAVLWLGSAAGSWSKGLVAPQAFVDDGSGYVRLTVNASLDPKRILIQPQHDGWAQAVELGVHDTVTSAVVAPLA